MDTCGRSVALFVNEAIINDKAKSVCLHPPGIILCVSPANERWLYHVAPSNIGCVHTQNVPSNHNETEQNSFHLHNSFEGLYRRHERVRDYIMLLSHKLFTYHIFCLRRLVHNSNVDKPMIYDA